jgi:uncharacterized membrane protein YwaF
MLSANFFFIGNLVGALSAITRPTKETLLGVMIQWFGYATQSFGLKILNHLLWYLILGLVDLDP